MSTHDHFDPSRRAFLGATAGGTALTIAGLPSQALARINAPHESEKLKETTEVFGFCDMCYWRCGLKIRSRDGRAVKIDGNSEHPNNWGVVCAKGNSGLMVAYAPNRLKYPMKRVGERGAGQWERITWDEALDTVAQELKKVKEKHGPQALSMIGHGTWEKPYHRLAHAFGTPNTTSPVFGLCCGPRGLSNMIIIGRNLTGNETIDLENCKYFLMMGRNITESLHNGETLGWVNGVANGAKVVYFDPRYTITASKADEYYAIRPLTDHAFLLAMIHVVINEELYDKKFVTEYVDGLDELKQRVQKYTPEWAEPITEVPAKDIRRLAREMAAKAPSVFVYAPRRMTRTSNDFGMGMSITILNTLFGVWGHKGGVFTPQKYSVPEIDLPEFKHAHLARRAEDGGDFDYSDMMDLPPEYDSNHIADKHGTIYRADGAGVPTRWPVANAKYGLTNEMWRAIAEQKPYPIRALITAGGNGFLNSTNYDIIRKALETVDFYVAADVSPNEMNMYADILLPEASYLERYDDLQVGGAREAYVAVRMPAMKPLHDTRDAWTICKQLADRMDLGAYFPHDSIKELLEDRMKKAGSSLAEIEKVGILKIPADPAKNFPLEHGGKLQIKTPSGSTKAELIPGMLKMMGYDKALDYVEQVRPNEDEFHMTFGRIGFHTHARTQDNIWTADFMRENVLWIHPEPAAKRGIKEGDLVKVSDRNDRSGEIKAKVTARIRKDSIFMVHGFGHWDKRMTTAYGMGVADSDLASYAVDPHIGTMSMGLSLVKVEKV
ncbi:MAG: molybdopterin oxidoreductase [Gammaproteobacteria bacterium]|nr:MAG: molybdopterin oxidoreductase [Gammaproteobacteria bacterium]RKZ41452.1 MAG: molybdopterin oxidoreductase [Gammaproteobacteria bacterium]RKZ74037.1 MAG: molybdopterin oxidoreductase [Gammaproteobacteria bacterium]